MDPIKCIQYIIDMVRAHRKATKLGYRICNRCETELPATPEIFLRDASRYLGLAYECRTCHSARKIGRDRRTERWVNHTPDQRRKAKDRQYRYNRTDKGRAVFLASAYKRIDAKKGYANDITSDYLLSFVFEAPCTYCGTVDDPIGCDRIDNSKGHTIANTVPACVTCNFARGDRLTHEEMLRVGHLISEIRADRLSKITENEDRL